MNLKQAFSRACTLILIPCLFAGCTLTPEAKASKTAAEWMHDLQSGETVSSPSNKTFLQGFEDLSLESMPEADQEFEKEYLKSMIRSWEAVEAYQQNGKIIVCMLVNFADPDSLTEDALLSLLKDHPVALQETGETHTQETSEEESSNEESSEEEVVLTEESDASEAEVSLEEADLQTRLDQLAGDYKPEIQKVVLQAVKDAPEIAAEVYFQIDPDDMSILSIY